MKIIRGPFESWEKGARGRAVTVGVFDGVHLGHRRIIDLLCRGAGGRLDTAVLTFDPHPLRVVAPGFVPELLTPLDHKLEIFSELGVDVVAVLAFDQRVGNMSAEEFAGEVIAGAMGADLVVVGENFRFGHRRLGDVAALTEFGNVYGFSVEVAPLVGGRPALSSTSIRRAIAGGDVAGAAAALGRPHEVRGRVVAGSGRAREIGFPTANVQLPQDVAVPARGVYAVRMAVLGEEPGPGVANIGVRPTFEGDEEVLEVHLLGGDDVDLQDRSVRVVFIDRLRPELRFSGKHELAAQIRLDIAAARRLLEE
jgi:riboflavin kinase/FMN adenylyltransferase